MSYLLSNIPFVVSLILFVLIGHTLLLEKKRVPSVLFLMCTLLGIWLGSYGKELNPTEYVIPLALVALGLFVALQIEFTMVGFALMAIVIGFFNGHDMGLNLSYTIRFSYFMTYVIVYGVVIIVITEKLIPILTRSSYGLKVIGSGASILGILLFLSNM